MSTTLEARTRAVKAALGLGEGVPGPTDGKDEKITLREVRAIAEKIGELLEDAVYKKLVGHPPNRSNSQDSEFLDALWAAFLQTARKWPVRMLPKLSGCISDGIKTASAVAPKPSAGVTPKPAPAVPPAVPPRTIPAPHPRMDPLPPPLPPPPAAPPQATAPPLPAGSPWKYLPVPPDPDPHAESDERCFDAPAGYKLFGARVRGKKHKHDGTNCDDWFEAGHAAGWTIIAVADGAGSKKFSRVGAKAACSAAVQSLAAAAPDLVPPAHDLESWGKAVNDRDPAQRFQAPFLALAAQTLHTAVQVAYDAVEDACQARQKPEAAAAYEQVLGKPIEMNDLSCTLLLALHRVVQADGHDLDLVVACQVGDGMTAAVHRNGSVVPLGAADGGEFSGETEFLTSSGKRDSDYLTGKTFVRLGGFQAIMVMTDGVADDYFPYEQHMGRLWADLLLNRIPDVGPPPADADTSFDSTTCDEVREIIGPKTPREEVRLRSCAKLAERKGVPAEELAKQFGVLTRASGDGLRDYMMGLDDPAHRLRVWLDAYVVRGSFDDRTLVVLHREALP